MKVGDVVEVWAQPETVHNARYAFSPFKISVPVKILEEYPRWYLGLVLPHVNPSGFGRESHPYRITIPKHDIETGVVTIKERERSCA